MSVSVQIPAFYNLLPASLLESTQVLDDDISKGPILLAAACNNSFQQTRNNKIESLLRSTVLMGGKRLRPLLTFMMGDFLGMESKTLLPYAKAIEMVHAASLSHDDVIDQATQRRGRPSINVLASNKRAILAGDYLLAEVIHQLAQLGSLEAIKSVSEVLRDLSEGEWLQWEALEERHYSSNLIDTIAAKKTASVMSWSCWIPSFVKGLSEHQQAYAHQFGHRLGMGFQRIDDCLDFVNSAQKDQQLDLQNNQVNSVMWEWLELNPRSKARYLSGTELASIFTQTELQSDSLAEAIQTVKSRALIELKQCHDLLDTLAHELPEGEWNPKAKQALESLLVFVANRDH